MEPQSSHNSATVSWSEGGHFRTARWLSTRDTPPPRRVELASSANVRRALRSASQGVATLWRGDYPEGRRLLAAMGKRLDRTELPSSGDPARDFYRYRQARRNRARTLGMLLVELGEQQELNLRRAPAVRRACRDAYGDEATPGVVSLRELLGALSARQWRVTGIDVAALGARIQPHYGVFPPTRQDYVDLVASADVPAGRTAFDIGTGTGVLAVILARRGLEHVVATDIEPRAVACALANVRRLGVGDRVTVTRADLFPPGRADVVVCNPPWLPGSPSSSLDGAVFDANSRMLSRFLREVSGHLAPGGEAWLVLSDLAERLGLRSRQWLLAELAAGGLVVRARFGTEPRHDGPSGEGSSLDAARARERVWLWRLAAE